MKLTHLVASISACCALGAMTHASILIDFSTDDGGVPLLNGQDISSPPEFGNLVNINGVPSAGNAGPAIFDSSFAGPNASGPDPDLIVGLGNILIVQDGGTTTQTVPGIFDTPNDDAGGGAILFDFLQPVTMESIDLIDINGNNQDVLLILTDSTGETRTYDVPSSWTKDIDVAGPNGFDTLDLTTLADQLGEGGSTATASETALFDPSNVIQMSVSFNGSGGLDNVRFIPAPASAALFAIGAIGFTRRRR